MFCLDHLGLGSPEEPPDVREVVRGPVDDEGREIGASPLTRNLNLDPSRRKGG